MNTYKTAFVIGFVVDDVVKMQHRMKGTDAPCSREIKREYLSPNAIEILEAFYFATEQDTPSFFKAPFVQKVFDHVPTNRELNIEIAAGNIGLGQMEVNFRELLQKFLDRQIGFSALKAAIR